MNQENSLFAAHALLPGGWAQNVLLRWDAQGCFTSVQADAEAPQGVMQAAGPVLPGMPNLHSHAFQRGFAGLSEFRGQAQDSFWSWRNLMYRFAARLSPQHLEAIATWLYIEMLEAGYTSVCEFHYLHHQPDGQPYAPDSELSLALLRAAKTAGIGITLLPVLYQNSGFGGLPPGDGQKRFIRSTDNMLRLLEALAPACAAQGAALGLAPHSLRAVAPDALKEAVQGLHALNARAPVHIHIAEQMAEVNACLQWSGQRPVAWLLDHMPVDARWCLVHATHMDDAEYAAAAASEAVAGLCPLTEANLGDGIFDLPRWQAGAGRWGIGSDSHIGVNAAEELMVLEYSQRLQSQQRNVAASALQPHVASHMMLAAVQGGAQAAGRNVAGLAVGQQADCVVLDGEHFALAGLPVAEQLDSHVFASSRSSAVASVWVAGQCQVEQGRHTLNRSAQQAFVAARSELLA
ncbi:formimidoylglutamate deiminase [Comamonas odontotermitis]|uniref:formimidoylglutamate deiminase n=1 Tax=Comamonas odontotermitis TaxID=379895 RepID=UPI003752AA9A